MRFSKPFIAAVLCIAVAGSLTAASFAADKTAPKSITIPMKALNNSTEDGVATLTQVGKDIRITIELKNAPAADQPTHIHAGTCASINPSPEFPLEFTSSGKSTSLLKGETIDFLLSHPYAINIHRSTGDLATYVSCGNIKV